MYSINSQGFFLYMHKGDSAEEATSTSSWTFKSSTFSKLRERPLKKGGSYEVPRQLTNVLSPSMHSHYIYSLAYRTGFVFIFTAIRREIHLSPSIHLHPFQFRHYIQQEVLFSLVQTSVFVISVPILFTHNE